jgi:hypothetical protein
MNLSGKYKFVPICNITTTSGGVDSDAVNMTNAHRLTVVLLFGACTGTTVMTLYSGATAGAKTSALNFKHALGSAAIGSNTSDVLGTESTSALLSIDASTYQNKMLLLEVDTAQFDMNATIPEPWFCIEFAAGASAGVVHAVAIVEPRYSDGTTLLT